MGSEKSFGCAFRVAMKATVSGFVLLGASPVWAQDAVVSGSVVQEEASQSAASAGASAAALSAAPVADVASDAEIVVTGSRIARSGADQPTPVTMLTAVELSAAAPTIGQALIQMPQLANSTSTSNPNNMGGISSLDLRSLSPNRTLVLLNGRRLTPATTGTAPDMNSLPQNLIQQVDIVTGGASAAYGSDAVAGVVNLVLDTKFEGLKLNIQGGITDRWDNANYLISGAAGTSFGGGRGHIVVSAEYYDQAGVLTSRSRKWDQQGYLPIPNPAVTATNPASASNPNILILPNSGLTRAIGGRILSGPLAGIQFGAGGVPIPFQTGEHRSTNYMQGGDAAFSGNAWPLDNDFWRFNAYARASYDLTDNLTIYGEVITSRTQSWGRTQPANYDLPIYSGNAFLPETIQAEMTRLGLSSITVGKIAMDWEMDPNDRLYKGGMSVLDDRVTLDDYVAGLDGKYSLGEREFTFNAYYQKGHSTYERIVPNNPINANLFNAMDAVTVTTANQGTSGLPIGSIVCRTSLTDPANGCVPLNIFGPGAASQGALDYIYESMGFKQSTRQDAAAVSTQGEVFDTWAGPVSIALGAEWRKVRTVVTSDELSQMLPTDYVAQYTPGVRGLPGSYLSQNRGVFLFGNYQPLRGSYNVKEAFFETVVPLASDTSWANHLEFNGAVRYTDYSSSGGVWTWKTGLVYEPFNSLRIRATKSRDIRAANIIEQFSGARLLPFVVRDPVLGNSTYTIQTYSLGNRDLDPEKADTTTVGIVYQPSWAPGLTLSADFYDIKIKDVIIASNQQQVVDQCFAGSADFCSLIDRDPGTNMITALRNPNLNLATLRQRGIDFEAGYSFDLAGGQFGLRGFANYVDKLELSTLGGSTVDRAGETGPGNGGLPHWIARLTASYNNGPWTVIAQERYISGGHFNNTYNTDRYNNPGQPITYINDNDMPAVFYTDLTVKYGFEARNGEAELYFTVNNLFDQDPPIAPTLSNNMPQTNFGLYNVLGRAYTAGLRVKF